ncbi:hypothetical protein [Chengkuizengella marina]|uniref:YtxH-like protein n=1 Tax=Chengkuizengella marina TaxID=2507566 RepID=A0A6N9PY44_9BACL|nr:hypothetical protein [Chengkuizengella marina]NBI27535.1 hypothetical protein [Chengkuizengella marina]
MSDKNINSKDFLLGIVIGGVLGAVGFKFLGGADKETNNNNNHSSNTTSSSESPSDGVANNVTVKARAVSSNFNDVSSVFPVSDQSQLNTNTTDFMEKIEVSDDSQTKDSDKNNVKKD